MPNTRELAQFSASFAEINAKNKEYINAIKKHRAFSQIAKILKLPILAEIYSAARDNSLADQRVRLIGTLVNELRAIGKIPHDVYSTAVEHLEKSNDNVDIVIVKLIKAIAKEPFDAAAIKAVNTNLDLLITRVSDQYGVNLFYQYLTFQGQIHCPVMVEIYNAINDPTPEVLLRQREAFIKKIIDTVHTLFLSSAKNLAGKVDINVAALNNLLASHDYGALANIFKKWTDRGTEDIAMLSRLALAMLESKKNNDVDSIELSKKIWEIYSQWQTRWFGEFGKDAIRDGLIIKDKQFPGGKKLLFSIVGNQIVCTESDPYFTTIAFPTGITIKKQVIYTKKPGESDNLATAKAIAEYLRKHYKINNELNAYILSTLHQGGYVQGYFSLQYNIKTADGRFNNPASAVPELCFDQDQQLQSIVINQHFYGLSIEDRNDNLFLADISIVREYPGRTMPGDEPLEHYIPGTLPVDEGKVTYVAKCEQGKLTVTDLNLLEDNQVLSACDEGQQPHQDDEMVAAIVRLPVRDDSLTHIIAEELAETPAVKPAPVIAQPVAVPSVELAVPPVKSEAKSFLSYFTENPGKAIVFFIGGCLLVTAGIAAWPFTTALLAGAGLVGAASAIATFVTGMAIPVAIASGLGTIAGGFLATTLAALTSKTSSAVVSPAVTKVSESAVVQQQPAIPQAEVPVAFSDRVTLRRLNAAKLMQERQRFALEINQLREVIQLIKDSLDAKGKVSAVDLNTLLTKDALLMELRNFLEPLLANNDSSEKLMSLFDGLLARVMTQNNPGVSRTAPVDLINYLKQLALPSLDTLIRLMEEKLPRTPGQSPEHSPRGNQTPRAGSPGRGGDLMPATQMKQHKPDDKNKAEKDEAAAATGTAGTIVDSSLTDRNQHASPAIATM